MNPFIWLSERITNRIGKEALDAVILGLTVDEFDKELGPPFTP
ncbi:hypothetical protein ACM26W_18230 [Halomonas sp. HK25]